MNLSNVTKGVEIRGIVTSNDAAGHASVMLEDGKFSLHAEFVWLTDPEWEDFYEGWLVQQSPLKFISTGELYKKDWNYHNRFDSKTNYSSYDFYVLTLEPNDNDPAPAAHVFEWKVIMHEMKMMDKTMEMKKKEKRKKLIKARIQSKIKTLSLKKVAIILERVEKLRTSLDTRDISPTKRAAYDEVLDVFVEVLESEKITEE